VGVYTSQGLVALRLSRRALSAGSFGYTSFRDVREIASIFAFESAHCTQYFGQNGPKLLVRRNWHRVQLLGRET
jgi:hypothetical protein